MDIDQAKPSIRIAGQDVGSGFPPYIIAEMSANHLQRFDRAVAIIQAAATAGADAVKLQTYTADSLTIDCDRPPFIIEAPPWKGQRLYDLYRQAAMPWEWYPELLNLAQDVGIHLFSTPFCSRSLDFLESVNPPVYKIASFELVDFELIRQVASTGRPVIMSTGAATESEVTESVNVLKLSGCRELAILHCVSSYPAAKEQMYLQRMLRLGKRFDVPVGLSDHSLDPQVPVTAAQLGASVIEKHLTLARSDGGPDAAFSLEPDEFYAMVAAVRKSWQSADGGGSIELIEESDDSSIVPPGLEFRRSLFVVQDMEYGEAFTAENVQSIRPGAGLHPRHLPEILGRKSSETLSRGTPLSWDVIE